MRHSKTGFALIFGFILLINNTFGQSEQQPNVITTAVPFLLISPDARAGGMGSVGVSTSADAYSLFWNPAKYAFIDKDFGFGIGYVPWLRNVVNDIGLASLAFYKRFGDKQAIASSLAFLLHGGGDVHQ